MIAGTFYIAGGVIADGVAAWDGVAWTRLGDGIGPISSGNIAYAVAVVPGPFAALGSASDEEAIVLGGRFTMSAVDGANNVAAWRGGKWTALGTGLGAYVYALATFNGAVVAGGSFTYAGPSPGVTLNRTALWDGTAWRPLGVGMNGGVVYTLLAVDDGLLAGGSFSLAGNVAASDLARWDGTAWSAFGGAGVTFGTSVDALAVYGGDVIAAGSFSALDEVSASNIAAWNGTTWRRLGTGVDSMVYSLVEHNGNLLVGGGFYIAGGVIASRIARWDGTEWSALSEPIDSGNYVYCLASMESRPSPAPPPTVPPGGT